MSVHYQLNYLQNSDNLGQISFFIGEIFEEIKVVRFFLDKLYSKSTCWGLKIMYSLYKRQEMSSGFVTSLPIGTLFSSGSSLVILGSGCVVPTPFTESLPFAEGFGNFVHISPSLTLHSAIIPMRFSLSVRQ